MSELKTKLENLQCTLTDPVSAEDIRAAWHMIDEIISDVTQLEADLKLRPSVKLSDGDVWLIFPDAAISIEGICRFRIPGPIVRRNLRKWRDELLKEALGGDDGS